MGDHHRDSGGWGTPPKYNRNQVPSDRTGNYHASGTFRSEDQTSVPAQHAHAEDTARARQDSYRELPPLIDPDFTSDDESDDEIRRKLAELEKLQKEKAARKAQRQISRCHSDVRFGGEGDARSNRGIPTPSERHGDYERNVPSTPARSSSTQDPNEQRQGSNNTAISPVENASVGLARPGQKVGRPDQYVPRESTRPQEAHKYYEGKRLASSSFSPGYGFRQLRPGVDYLPREEELVTPEGAVHRVYPAPAPICPPANADQGWEDHDEVDNKQSSTASSHSLEVVLHENLAIKVPNSQQPQPLSPPLTAPATPSPIKQEVRAAAKPFDPRDRSRDAPPHLAGSTTDSSAKATRSATAAPAKTAYVSWPTEGVQISDPQKVKDQMDELSRLYEQRQPFRQVDRYSQAPRPPIDQGYGSRADRGGYGGSSKPRPNPPQDSGWDTGTSGDDDWGAEPAQAQTTGSPNAGGWGDAVASGKDHGWGGQESGHGGSGGGRGEGDSGYGFSRGGDDGCGKCGQPGHFARGCPQAGGDKCFKCGEIGHMSRECAKAGGDRCFNCGEKGHLSRDCPQEKRPSGACHNCGEEGHQARACTQPQKLGSFHGNCHKCGERGHMSSRCPGGAQAADGYGGYGGDNFGSVRGYDDGYSNRVDSRRDDGNDTPGRGQGDAWGKPTGDRQTAQAAEDDAGGWGDSSNDVPADVPRAPSDQYTRPAPAIHPSRLGLVNATRSSSPSREYQRHGRQENDHIPNDGMRRDNGWGTRAPQPSYQSGPIPRREPTPPPVSQNGYGGW
ncbi:hypothetical protein IAT40_002310 [Kwoniella sp. CBS 6097]